jgi:hypothetical protein
VFCIFGRITVSRPSQGCARCLLQWFFAGILVCWINIDRSESGNWDPDVARQTTVVIGKDILMLSSAREFE